MKKLLAVLLCAAMLVSSSGLSASAVNTKKSENKIKPEYAEGEAIVVLKDSADSNYVKPKMASAVYGSSIKLKKSVSFNKEKGSLRMAVLKSSKLSTKELISKVKKNAEVKRAFPNYKKKITAYSDDTYSKFQWALSNTGQENGTKDFDIKAEKLNEKASKSDKEEVVAVIDTGINYKHEDLKDVLWHNPYGSKLLGQYGIDLTGTNADLKPMDDHGHGTHCAGIIAARGDNKKGISGINKSNVKIMSVKVLDSEGAGYSDAIIAGYEYVQRAIELGTNVTAMNLSFGGGAEEDEIKTIDEIFNALGEKGVVTCVAAGNEGVNLNDLDDPDSEDYSDGYYLSPACSSSPYCVTVGAVNEKGEIPEFSNYGDKYVDVAAPGVAILSTVAKNCFNPTIYSADELNKLCLKVQKYNGSLKEGDFGYPKIIGGEEYLDEYRLWDKVKIDQSDLCFGTGGKSLAITPTDKREKKTVRMAFEIPFKLENEDDKYHISFTVLSEKTNQCFVADMPAEMDIDDLMEDYDYYEPFYSYPDNDWTHYDITIDPKDEDYEKSVDRKLIFIVDSSSTVWFDDLAVSKQLVSEDDFGKYDFYSGTSMATPYVTGAVAMLKRAYPKASASELANMAANTGEQYDSFDKKIKFKNFLTLENVELTPPLISKAGYDKDGNVKIEGSFKEITKAYVNDEEVKILSKNAESVVIPDNNYSTYTVDIKLENKRGADTIKQFLSKKAELTPTKKVMGTPEDTSTAIMVSSGYKAYFIDTAYGTIGVLDTLIPKKAYTYNGEEYYDMKLKDVMKSDLFYISSAIYLDNKIYFTARSGITTKDNSYVLGYNTMFGYYDLDKNKTVKLCELPEEALYASSLGVLKKNIYLIGGYNINNLEFIDSVYKYDSSKKQFTKTSSKLPEPRGYTEFVECDGKLVGMYGGIESGEMPPAIVFDGKNWKQSSYKFKSSDSVHYEYNDEKSADIYSGNVGLDKNGVFCNGSFVDGIGDTFTYNVADDSIIENKYCFRNDVSTPSLVGATVAGAFIGFNVNIISTSDDDDEDSYSFPVSTSQEADTSEIRPYMIELDNVSRYPKPKDPKISDKMLSLNAGNTKTIKVSNAKVKSWKSSDSKVASVSGGKVTALKKGYAEITATLSNGKQLFCDVTVKTSPSIKIGGKKFKSSEKYSVKTGSNLTVKIKGKASSVKNAYKTSNKNVAKVTSPASADKVKIKALKKGSAKVTVKVNGVSFKINVKVK